MESIKIKKINRIKRKNSYVKLIFTIFVLAGALSIIVPLAVYLMDYYKQNSTIATVNGEPIFYREFERFLSDNRASVYDYFKQKYNVDDSPKFWTSSYGGEIPVEVARKQTLGQLTEIKIEQSLAKEKGIMKDIRYSVFLKNLQKENKRRKEAVEKNQVIYGPVEYRERKNQSTFTKNLRKW